MSTASVTSAYMRTSCAYHIWNAEQAMSAVASSATRGCARRRLRTNMLSGSFWQFFPLLLAAGVTLRWGQTTNDAPRCDVTERAGRHERRHTATHGRYIQWPWLTFPTVATANPR